MGGVPCYCTLHPQDPSLVIAHISASQLKIKGAESSRKEKKNRPVVTVSIMDREDLSDDF